MREKEVEGWRDEGKRAEAVRQMVGLQRLDGGGGRRF